MAKKNPGSAPQQSQQQNKKKKKKSPQQQPTCNPVLNPNPESEEQKRQKKEDRDGAINILQHRVQNCPTNNAPPKKLLTLVGGFLTSYGFDSAYRLFQLQCNARNRLDGWDSALDENLLKDHPNLLRIYKEWERNDKVIKLLIRGDGLEETKESKDENLHQQEVEADDTSSSGDSTSENDSTSSSEGDLSADSDVEMKDDTPKSAKGAKDKTSISTSSSSSSSDSDTSDEEGSVDDNITAPKPTVKGLTQKLKKRSDAAKAKLELQAKKSDKPTKQSKRAPEPTSSSSSSATSRSGSDSSSSSTDSVVSKLADDKTKTKRTLKVAKRIDDPSASVVKSLAKLINKKPKTKELSKDSRALNKQSDKISKPEKDFKVDKSVGASGSTDFDISSRQTKSLAKQTKKKKTSKAAMSTSSDDSSSSSIDSDVPDKQADTKSKFNSKATSKKASLSSSESSSSSPYTSDSGSSSSPSSSSISDPNPSPKPAKASIDSNLTKTSSDSTATFVADSPPPVGPPILKRKRNHSPSANAAVKKANPQSFRRVPADTKIDKGFESNQYRSYDYADQAHKNLSVVKGKGFTKEKNKQKKKNYRGGMIDIEGARGVKFG
ncbi:MAG: hypothetical protein Q9167_005554 [Letrouitia subvulpina]